MKGTPFSFQRLPLAVTTAIAAAGFAVALAVMSTIAGWSGVIARIRPPSSYWFGVALAAELVSFCAYVFAYRSVAAVEGGRVWMIGIPGRGDMAAVEALCASRGLTLTEVSWRR